MTDTDTLTEAANATPNAEELINGLAELMAYSKRTLIFRRPDEYGVDYEDVFFPAVDGVTLEGWFIPADSDRAEFPDGFSSTAAGEPDRHFGDARDSFQLDDHFDGAGFSVTGHAKCLGSVHERESVCDERVGDFRSAGQHLRCEEHLAATGVSAVPHRRDEGDLLGEERGVRHVEPVGVNTEERDGPARLHDLDTSVQGADGSRGFDDDVVSIVGRRFAYS